MPYFNDYSPPPYLGFENCSRTLSRLNLEQQITKSIIEDENGEIVFGSSINGRKLNYAEKMVLAMMKQRKSRQPCQ